MELPQEQAPSPEVLAIDPVDNQHLINEAWMRSKLGDRANFDCWNAENLCQQVRDRLCLIVLRYVEARTFKRKLGSEVMLNCLA
jgi:hypothetical protein